MGWRDSPGLRLGPRSWVWQLIFFMVACVTVLLALQAFRPPASTPVGNTTEDDAPTFAPDAASARERLADDEFFAPPPLETPTTPRRRKDDNKRANAAADLSHIHDDTLGIRFDEADSFFELLQQARQTSPDDLIAQVRYDVQHVNLLTDPERYRGQVMTVAGNLLRLTPFTPARNRQGLQTLYEAWIVTPDSAPRAYRVVTSQLSDRIPLKDHAQLPVVATGYFLKQEGYMATNGVEVAPVILAAALDRDETVFHPAGMSTFPTWMLGLVVAGGLILTATMISMALSERTPQRKSHPSSLSVETLTALTAMPPFSIHGLLRELEEIDQARQFETLRRPVLASSVNPPHVPIAKPKLSRDVELPTPTPPTRQFRRGWKQSWTDDGSAPESNDSSGK